MPEPVNLADYAALARERLPKGIHDWIAGGAADDITLAENESAWGRIRLRPRVLIDVASVDLRTSVLGREIAMPILTAPCGLNNAVHPDGEIGVARAAAAAGTIQVVSLGSGLSLEEIAAAAPSGSRWFQLYILPDRGVTRALVERAEAAGYSALCLTVDAAVDGIREHNLRNHFRAPPAGFGWANLLSHPDPRNLNWQWAYHDAALTWKDIAWLRGITRLPIVLKGILAPEDARLAVEHGAAGLIVSNHGGRQLDTSITPCEALPDIAEAVAGRIEIYADSGIRRGSDVLKALALGARAVLIGRPYVWGLAVAGEPGVRRILEILRAELSINMALTGCPSIQDVTIHLIR